MYNQLNLGDCFLLKFTSGPRDAYMLIDFGSYMGNNTDREREIALDIKKTIGNEKLTMVLTHQHKDHYSGFLHAGDLLEGSDRELWLSYLDSEDSKEGKAIRSTTEKYWKKNAKTKKLLLDQFKHVPAVKSMVDEKEGFDLFAEGQSRGEAITKLLEISGHNVRFLTPGQSFFLDGLGEAVKVYVLGPPFDNDLLTKMNPTASEAVEGLRSSVELANLDISGTMMMDALEGLADPGNCNDADFPFNRRYIDEHSPLRASYEERGSAWRRVDHEWLSEVGRLSLYMDRLTNNTSLALAFELVDSKKVLLFVGDAQIGNWQSWFNVKFDEAGVTGENLLSRTVFYKAGHHSSHNATLRQGLDLMNEKELIIMIPVDEKVSTKFKFAMLKPEMLKGYHRKSKGRVLRSDKIVQDGSQFNLDFPFIKEGDLGGRLRIFPETKRPHLWMELEVGDGVGLAPAVKKGGTKKAVAKKVVKKSAAAKKAASKKK